MERPASSPVPTGKTPLIIRDAFTGILNCAVGAHTMSSDPFLSVRDIATRIRRKEVSPVEVARAHLSRIERLNPRLNAFVDCQPEAVLRQAREAEQSVQRGDELGSLHGVPISIKSSIDVAGHRCEAGTRLRAGYIATADAPLVARLRAAGAIILGVTNVPELLMAWETDNLLCGRTNNPWDLTRTAGGSSGGEAAAIAAGLSAGGVGSDGGGSIREPAHFCGICGLKPTPGRVPSTGHFPKSGGPFALIGVVGPMARTIEDVRSLFEAMAGYDDGDPCSAPVDVPYGTLAEREKQLDRRRTATSGINIGFFEDDGRTPVTAETRLAVKRAVSILSGSGLNAEPIHLDGLEEARQLWWDFFGTAGGMILEPMVRGRESDLSPILKEFQSWTRAEPAHTGQSLLAAWLDRDAVREKILLQMRKYPVLVCPTAAIPAFRHAEREWQVEGKTVKYLDAWSYCEWFNLLGFPAVVIPMGSSAEGLPIGVQVIGRPWQENIVLDVAANLEQGRGPWQAPPLD
jgi:Asp-tRNA(Asn)/Glu-tRNA(Gln) amidotransferase A subunit family amidase